MNFNVYRGFSVLMFGLLVLSSSCKKDKPNPDPETPDNPYAGMEIYVGGSLGNTTAAYWKNGEPQHFREKRQGELVNDILLVGQDIYLAGRTIDETMTGGTGRRRATYWKNGKAVVVDPKKDADGKKIYVAPNGDVYLLGDHYLPKETWATIWKNGKLYPLQEAGSLYYVRDMLVVGNDFYVIGSCKVAPSTFHAVIWKNGKVLKIYDYKSSIEQIGHDGTSFYYQISSSEDPQTKKSSYKVYKNDMLIYSASLTDEENKRLVTSTSFQKGADSYKAFVIAKDDRANYGELRLWKNGQFLNTKIQNVFRIQDIYVKNADVYFSLLMGNQDNFYEAIYKNDQRLPMNIQNEKSVDFNAVFAK